MSPDDFKSLSDEVTFVGAANRRPASEVSLGDEQTLGDGRSGQDTVIDDIEVVDLDARYRVEGTLGQGGMGAVLLATDTRLERKVAIKRILGEAAGNRMAVLRFLTEAKAIAAINHPNIVQIYDYGRAKDGPFLIMEYVDGGSLLDRCRESALPLEEAIDLACQLCDGLAKAHDLGIIHRDIKPANVLLTKDGIPKLTDFGLAKAQASDHGQTMTGAVLGTPDFMPPEQRRDAGLVDHRSDLWSLAATIYQMVTGRSPKIIRFDLLPVELTKVLGKALEDAKESRYQSARELRDALKTSLITAAPSAAEVGEGQCLACGVKNDSSRRFCRGCGEALEAPCLSCSKPMPIWEQICGQCGTKQIPLLDERRGEMAARQAEAEGLVKDYDFDQAERLTVLLRDEPDPRLKQLVPWATAFIEKIGKARDAQLAQACERLTEGLKHEASFDYPSAIHTLQQVPGILRSSALGEHGDSVQSALDRVSEKQAEVSRLERLVKQRIASRELSGLLQDVETLRNLRPDRTDVRKLCAQLEERQQKLVAQRDEAVAIARSHLDSKDYESVLAALRKVDGSVETPEVWSIRSVAADSFERLQTLLKEIGAAVAGKHLDGLLGKVETALDLKPNHGELAKLRERLLAREEALLSRAETAFQSGNFEQAAALMRQASRRTPDVTLRLERCEHLASMKSAVLSRLRALLEVPDLATATEIDVVKIAGRGRRYLKELSGHGLTDKAVEQWCLKCEAAATKREAIEAAARRAKKNRRNALVGVTTAVSALMLVSSGIWYRSTVRQTSLNAALARSDWQAALELDPGNVDAMVGFAKAKLAANPPDVAGAFAVIERAEAIAGNAIMTKQVRADAHAARAIEHARGGRLSDAGSDYDAAKKLGGENDALPAAKAAIIVAWLDRTEKAVNQNDSIAAAAALAAATAAGALPRETAAFETRTCLLQAQSLCAKGDGGKAVAKVAEASRADASVARNLLGQPDYDALKQAVVADYRGRFEAALERSEWDSALDISVALGALDQGPAEWIGSALPKFPGLLSAVPAQIVGQLSPTVLAAVPPATLAALPIPTLSSLPPATVVALPPATVTALPSAAIVALPPIQNSIGMKLKLLPAGSFVMGQADGEPDETPRQVTLTKPFLIGVYEVTREQWNHVMGQSFDNQDYPAWGSSWDDAEEFCRRLSALPEEKAAGRVYRLPTEAEWEYACRAGTETTYSFGDDAAQLGQYADFDEGRSSFGESPSHVGTKKPNPWGLYDMHGNVWEWCSDFYGQWGTEPVTDPQGSSLDPDKELSVEERFFGRERVVRGGGCANSAKDCRSASRVGSSPRQVAGWQGFRIASSLPEANLPEAAAR